MVIVALGLATLLKIDTFAHFRLNWRDSAIGLIAVLPLAIALKWFASTDQATLKSFRDSQIDFFANIGFEFTWPRILIISLAAGISEEILFRGVLQMAASGVMPVLFAIILPNILFGLLHMRTLLYAFIAGIVGIYLGAIFIITDNLLAPMISHGVYDVIALAYTKKAISLRIIK